MYRMNSMSSSIVEQLTCHCNPGFVYRTKSTYNSHKKSKKHVAYVSKRKEEAITATKRDNEIDLINRMIHLLTREKMELKDEIIKLKDENEMLRTYVINLTNDLSKLSI